MLLRTGSEVIATVMLWNRFVLMERYFGSRAEPEKADPNEADYKVRSYEFLAAKLNKNL
jgi:energy-converting hydrogenase Eha subunit B